MRLERKISIDRQSWIGCKSTGWFFLFENFAQSTIEVDEFQFGWFPCQEEVLPTFEKNDCGWNSFIKFNLGLRRREYSNLVRSEAKRRADVKLGTESSESSIFQRN